MNDSKIISTVKKTFSFMQLSDKNILKVIKKILDKESGSNISEDVLTKRVVKYYYRLIAKKISANDLECIHKYIDYYKDDDNLVDNLSKFLNSLNIDITIDTYQQLLSENQLLSKLVSRIVSNKPIDVDNISSLLGAYCIMNNIGEEIDLDFSLLDKECSKYESSFKLYLKEILKYPVLSYYEERELLLKYKENNDMQARERLIKCNARLVVSIAYAYGKRSSIQIMDLVSEGILGLMDAIDKFDITMEYKLSTYAIWWIRQRVTRAIYNGDIVRIPVHVNEKLRKYASVKDSLSSELGRDVTKQEVADKLRVSVSKIEEYESLGQSVVSINKTVGDKDDSQLGDFIADEKGIDEDFSFTIDLRNALDSVNISDKEKFIIKLRYGLYDGVARTLDQVAIDLYKFGISETQLSRERIRQLEAKALKKMRDNRNIKQLGVYCGLEFNDSTGNNSTKGKSGVYNEKTVEVTDKLSMIDPIELKHGKIYDDFGNLPVDLVHSAIKNVINFNPNIIQKYNSYLKLSKYEEDIFYSKILPAIKSQLLICIEHNKKYNIDILNPNISFYRNYNKVYCEIIRSLKSGNYLNARKILDSIPSKNSCDYFKIYGLLEKLENNYEDSMKYYNKCLEFKNAQIGAFIELANLNIQMGNHVVGRKMFESLFDDKSYSFKSKINLIYLDILEGEYKHASSLLNQISIQSLNENELYVFNFVSKFLSFKNGINQSNNNYSYMFKSLLNCYSDLTVLRHLASDSDVHKNIDYREFLCSIQDKIRDLNGTHYTLFDMYKFHLHSPIGYCCGTLTSDVCVSTEIGTKNIIDIRPIILSENYDLSDNLHSEKIKFMGRQ